MKGLGRRMRRAIAESGMQDQEVARKMGVTQPGLSRWVNGHQGIRAKNLAKFCRVTKCDANWLLGLQGTQGRRPAP